MGAVKVKIKVHCNIGSLLKSEGRSQTWLADKIDTTPQMVSDWSNNKYAPSVGYILRIIKVTGWKLENMFEEE